MKRTLALLLSLCWLLSLSLFGCNDPECTHVWDNEHTCTLCDEQGTHAWSLTWVKIENTNTHRKTCICGAEQTADCSGGTANCTTPATCEGCLSPHGKPAPAAHTETISYADNGNGTHSAAYPCCNALINATEAHASEDGVCTLCGAETTVGGLTATAWEALFAHEQFRDVTIEVESEQSTQIDGQSTPMEMNNTHLLKVEDQADESCNISLSYQVFAGGSATPTYSADSSYVYANNVLTDAASNTEASEADKEGLSALFAQLAFAPHFSAFTYDGTYFVAENCNLSLNVYPFDSYIVSYVKIQVADGKLLSLETRATTTVEMSGSPRQVTTAHTVYTFSDYGTTIVSAT